MKKKKYVIIIPARLGSTRLPGKPLIILKGIPIIQRTYQRCIKVLPKNETVFRPRYWDRDIIRKYRECV